MTEDSFVRGPSGSIRGNRNQVSKSVQRIAMSSSSSSTSSPTTSIYSSSQSSSDSESDSHPLSSFTLINELLKSSSQSSMDLSNIGSDSYSNSSDKVIHSLKKKGIMRKCKSVKFIPAIYNEDDDGHKRNQVVLYSTSIGVIRSTFEACNKLRWEIICLWYFLFDEVYTMSWMRGTPPSVLDIWWYTLFFRNDRQDMGVFISFSHLMLARHEYPFLSWFSLSLKDMLTRDTWTTLSFFHIPWQWSDR